MRVWAYISTLGVLAAAGAWWGWRVGGDEARIDPQVLVTLVAVGTVGVLLRERDLGRHLGVSLATVVVAAALPLAGSVGAVVVGFVAYAADVRQPRLSTRAFNAAMTAFVAAVGAIVYFGLGGLRVDVDVAGLSSGELLLRVGAPLLVAYVTMAAVNALTYGVMSSLQRGTRALEVAWQALRSLGLGYLSHVVIAFLFAVLWGPAGLGAWSVVFVLGPLIAAHWSIGREAVSRREHQETVTTFVAALEQADPTSVGHSARVADLAELMGPRLGMGSQQTEELRYAALLHDIGMVAVRPDLPPDAETDQIGYLSAICAHSEAGVAVVSRLDFLTGALPAIAHHHERYDGLGYPAGLSGEEIPLSARIIAVADAFDALVGETDGRPASVAEVLEGLRRRAGSHLDPSVVEALVDVLRRSVFAESLAPGQPDADGSLAPPDGGHRAPLRPAAGPNHDHPSVSDAFAEWQPEAAVRSG